MEIPRLHILTDTTVQDKYSHTDLARMAFEGGAGAVQIRQKDFPDIPGNPTMFPLVIQVLGLPRKPWQKVIVNDYVELAAATNADGVHVGREDMDPREARNRLGPGKLIGVTVHSLEELKALGNAPIDYIGAGPVFGTGSKDLRLPPLGLEKLSAICAASPWPVIAIGNVTLQNAAQVIAAGAWGIAVLSAFCTASDPVSIAKQFTDILH